MNALYAVYSEMIIAISIGLFFSFLLGVIFDKLILKRLEKITRKTRFAGDDIIVDELRGRSMPFFLLTGVYLSFLTAGTSHQHSEIIRKVFIVLFVFFFMLLVARIISRMVRVLNQENNALLPTSSIITNVVNILVVLIGLLIILQTMGISIAPLLTALGVGGLAVALALQDTLSNLFSGIQIIISKKVNPGDYIRLDAGDIGCVTDITWRNTTILAPQNNIMVIPNSKLASAVITNYSLADKEVVVLVDVGVSYGSDLAKVETITLDVATEVMNTVIGGVPEFIPLIRFHTYSEFSIIFSVVMRARQYPDLATIKHEFLKKLYPRYVKEGIEIPFPLQGWCPRHESNVRPKV